MDFWLMEVLCRPPPPFIRRIARQMETRLGPDEASGYYELNLD